MQVIIFEEIRATQPAPAFAATQKFSFTAVMGGKSIPTFGCKRNVRLDKAPLDVSSPLPSAFYRFKTQNHGEICMLAASKAPPSLAHNSLRFSLATTSFHLSLSQCIFLPIPSKLSSCHLLAILLCLPSPCTELYRAPLPRGELRFALELRKSAPKIRFAKRDRLFPGLIRSEGDKEKISVLLIFCHLPSVKPHNSELFAANCSTGSDVYELSKLWPSYL